ncbi:Protein component of the small (40S) ribosomal subunit [Dimargaris cristalligena]|uniref:40S ribosomal protein S19-1 n=1 Tax=Dimargaris cristalligena TaxID=215637 RepID=A0A4P9ZZG3_9FUNG|nr:Protein component of the small (40S) ribosomal subunit [Dimargaris cristalligena]RKP38210.1 40S ribosomal protein S19-1 [Dimargaris cristalligena]|eukprot:RKP38210.1 40S ribosomal protein S19-1 [Dimargaris cristalligena]
MAGGKTLKDVSAAAFIKAYSAHLKRSGKLPVPEWVDLVKTSTGREQAPIDPDWFYIRTAAIARHIYVRGNVGVGRVSKAYGGATRRGQLPNKRCGSSGSVARKAIQGLEKLGVLEKDAAGGRILSSQGRRELDRISAQA